MACTSFHVAGVCAQAERMSSSAIAPVTPPSPKTGVADAHPPHPVAELVDHTGAVAPGNVGQIQGEDLSWLPSSAGNFTLPTGAGLAGPASHRNSLR